jgi:hypothetical protein
MSYICKYCDKSFSRESTLSVHVCEPKRRAQQQSDPAVQIGFKAYLRFYETTQGSAKLKTYEEFSSSPYYTAFVKFGRHVRAIRALGVAQFIDWLLKNNKKLDQWCKDVYYAEFMLGLIKTEQASDALTRFLETAQVIADDNNIELRDIFRSGPRNTLCYEITQGRISAWVVYNTNSGLEFLENLNPEQEAIIIAFIDPDFWGKKFKDYMADAEWIKHILTEAGL